MLQRVQVLVELLRSGQRLELIRERLKRCIVAGVAVERIDLRLRLVRERIVLVVGAVLAEARVVRGRCVEVLRVAGLRESALTEALLRLLRESLLWIGAIGRTKSIGQIDSGSGRIARAGGHLLAVIIGVRERVAGAVAIRAGARACRRITCLHIIEYCEKCPQCEFLSF